MKNIIICILSFLITCEICAQEQNTATKIDNDVSSYFELVNVFSVIYSGKEEPKYTKLFVNHPYLNTDEFRKGLISYENRVYPDVMLRLNQEKEELIILSPDSRFSVIVPRDRLDYAIIDSLLIVYDRPESADGKTLPQGYYIRVHNGDCQVWKREKYLQLTKTKDYQMINEFEKKIWRYIYKNGIFHQVRSKKSVLKVFDTNKKELNSYIKQHGLNFRKNPEAAIVALTYYYDELNK